MVNYPIPARTHHVDKYIVGLTILVVWSLAYLFVPRRLDAFVLSRIFKLVSLLAVNMLVFALAGEITFRLIDPWLARLGPFASKDTPSFLSPHAPVDGSIGQSNALGFRDREWSRQKISAAPRIIAIGDSFTYGAGVSYDDTFVTLLSQAVADRIPGTEILNMGVSAWGPHEELALLKSTVLDFNPDLVILNVYAGNDIVEDARFEPALFVGGHRYRVHVSGNWFHDYLGPQQWFLYHHLNYLTTVGRIRLKQAFGAQGNPGTRWQRSAQSFCSLYGKHPTPYFEYHWTEARHVYEEMLILLRSHGIDFLVVIHPDPEQLYEWTARHPCAPGMGLEAYDFERPQRHLQEWASAHLVPAVDLLPAFKKLPNPDAYFLGRIDDNHYSSDGHRLAAGQILPGLLERLAHRP
jgi:lysophospholipase L1-like esterase